MELQEDKELDSQIEDDIYYNSIAFDTYLEHIFPLSAEGYDLKFVYDYNFVEKYLSKHADFIAVYPIDEQYKAIFNHSKKIIYLVPILPENLRKDIQL